MPIRKFIICAAVIGLLISCSRPKDPAPAGPSQSVLDLKAFRPEAEFTGRILFQSDLDGDNDIYVLTPDGLTRLTDNSWDDRYPRWSPDGQKIAFSANPRGSFDLYVMDAGGGSLEAITDTPEDELDVAWLPDGRALAYTRDARRMPGGDEATWAVDLGTRKAVEAVRGFRRSNGFPDISPISRGIAFTGKLLLGGWGIFLFDPGAGAVRELAKAGGACRPRFSRDGRKIVYVSGEADGKGDIWVMNADGGAKDRITSRGDTYDYFPSWSPDGTRIVFCSNARDKYADRGDWGLYLIGLADRRAVRLLDTPGRDVFPDWR